MVTLGTTPPPSYQFSSFSFIPLTRPDSPACRYGPVQSVKPLPGNDGAGEAPTAVTVAFMDIKSACKALQTPHKLEERVLKTDFYDPASGACGSGSCPPAPEEKGGGPGGGGTPGPKSSGDVNRPVGGGGHWRHGSHQDNQGGRDYQNRNNHQARYHTKSLQLYVQELIINHAQVPRP